MCVFDITSCICNKDALANAEWIQWSLELQSTNLFSIIKDQKKKITVCPPGLWVGLGQSGCYLPGIHPTEGTSSCVYILYTQEVTRPRRIYTYVEIECQFCSKKSLKCSVLQKFAYKNFMPWFFSFYAAIFVLFPSF